MLVGVKKRSQVTKETLTSSMTVVLWTVDNVGRSEEEKPGDKGNPDQLCHHYGQLIMMGGVKERR